MVSTNAEYRMAMLVIEQDKCLDAIAKKRSRERYIKQIQEYILKLKEKTTA